MIKKIIINIFYFYKLPKKILCKINFYITKRNYNEKYFQKEQNKIFQQFNLNRQEGLRKLKIIKKDMKESSMSSEHEALFSSLSLNKNVKISEILEIGTFDGMNSLLLSKIFRKAKIDTIDLSYTEDDFKNFYGRRDKLYEFIKYRNNILKKSKSIKFLEKNSINLINANKKYDLIWIDGAHGYPVVCADIINSLHLINNEGIIN
jgi:predicted O-methyltransferase YrrM